MWVHNGMIGNMYWKIITSDDELFIETYILIKSYLLVLDIICIASIEAKMFYFSWIARSWQQSEQNSESFADHKDDRTNALMAPFCSTVALAIVTWNTAAHRSWPLGGDASAVANWWWACGKQVMSEKMPNMSMSLSRRYCGESVTYKLCRSVVYGHRVYILPHPKQAWVSHLLLDACLTLHSDAVQLHKNANHKDWGLTRSWFLKKGIFFFISFFLFFLTLDLHKFCSSSYLLLHSRKRRDTHWTKRKLITICSSTKTCRNYFFF